jgi:DNA-binding transcriptional ArsR family regulator
MAPTRGNSPVLRGRTGGGRDLASVGALVADQAKCRILLALGDGQPLPAGRLAAEAGVSAATASEHLRKLVAGGLLAVQSEGRNRHYRLASPDVATLIEALERLAPALPVRSLEQSQQVRAWRQARVCYDHTAGALGVGLMAAMVEQGHIAPANPAAGPEAGQDRYSITSEGTAFLQELGVAVPSGRLRLRYHPDSTEDGLHLSGALGRAMLTRFIDLGWLQRPTSRRLNITPEGRAGFSKQLRISLDD